MNDGAVDILLVDDNPSDVKLILYVLNNHGFGERVQVALDGTEALEFLFCTGRYSQRHIENQPRLILLDLKLPLLDGLETLQRIKSDARTRAVPVVVMTSSRAERDIYLCYELGVNSYIVKPIDFAEFSESVSSVGSYWLMLNESPSASENLRQDCGTADALSDELIIEKPTLHGGRME
jgi:two-component system response regulator